MSPPCPYPFPLPACLPATDCLSTDTSTPPSQSPNRHENICFLRRRTPQPRQKPSLDPSLPRGAHANPPPPEPPIRQPLSRWMCEPCKLRNRASSVCLSSQQ
ncbi:hypothetical protein M758_7G142300, partial [Ceratodon purpureus]